MTTGKKVRDEAKANEQEAQPEELSARHEVESQKFSEPAASRRLADVSLACQCECDDTYSFVCPVHGV